MKLSSFPNKFNGLGITHGWSGWFLVLIGSVPVHCKCSVWRRWCVDAPDCWSGGQGWLYCPGLSRLASCNYSLIQGTQELMRWSKIALKRYLRVFISPMSPIRHRLVWVANDSRRSWKSEGENEGQGVARAQEKTQGSLLAIGRRMTYWRKMRSKKDSVCLTRYRVFL